MSSKSNAEKVEKYLYRCASDPLLKSSTLLRDFFSPQREGDSLQDRDGSLLVCSSLVSPDHLGPSSSTTSRRSSFLQTDMDTQERTTDNAASWVPSPQLSMTSLPLSASHHQTEEDDFEVIENNDDEEFFNITRSPQNDVPYFPLDHLEMIKVLGKGCMGKVMLCLFSNFYLLILTYLFACRFC